MNTLTKMLFGLIGQLKPQAGGLPKVMAGQ